MLSGNQRGNRQTRVFREATGLNLESYRDPFTLNTPLIPNTFQCLKLNPHSQILKREE
jgi:hypothetical protein